MPWHGLGQGSFGDSADTATDEPEPRCEHRKNGRGTIPIFSGMDRYFWRCETPSVFADLEQWLPRRLRSAIWKQGKRGPVRFARLRRRNVNARLAAQTAGSYHGPRRLADPPALSIAFSNACFDSLGIPRLTVELSEGFQMGGQRRPPWSTL